MRTLALLGVILILAQTAAEAQSRHNMATPGIPLWVTNVPKDCFVGISEPCSNIEKARKKALESAIAQILQCMGAEYTLTHESRLAPPYLNESLAFRAKWFVAFVQKYIKKMVFEKGRQGYACYILVKLSHHQLEKLKRLSIGPKVSAVMIGKSDGQIKIKASEAVGVTAVITDYHVKMKTKNRHAKLISLFSWKIPESTTMDMGGVFVEPVTLRSNTVTFSIPSSHKNHGLKSIILGAKFETTITLHGYDEAGRKISVAVK
jgi:hypothetical protein